MTEIILMKWGHKRVVFFKSNPHVKFVIEKKVPSYHKLNTIHKMIISFTVDEQQQQNNEQNNLSFSFLEIKKKKLAETKQQFLLKMVDTEKI